MFINQKPNDTLYNRSYSRLVTLDMKINSNLPSRGQIYDFRVANKQRQHIYRGRSPCEWVTKIALVPTVLTQKFFSTYECPACA